MVIEAPDDHAERERAEEVHRQSHHRHDQRVRHVAERHDDHRAHRDPDRAARDDEEEHGRGEPRALHHVGRIGRDQPRSRVRIADSGDTDVSSSIPLR